MPESTTLAGMYLMFCPREHTSESVAKAASCVADKLDAADFCTLVPQFPNNIRTQYLGHAAGTLAASLENADIYAIFPTPTWFYGQYDVSLSSDLRHLLGRNSRAYILTEKPIADRSGKRFQLSGLELNTSGVKNPYTHSLWLHDEGMLRSIPCWSFEIASIEERLYVPSIFGAEYPEAFFYEFTAT